MSLKDFSIAMWETAWRLDEAVCLEEAVHRLYNFVQSNQPITERKTMPDPIGEVNAVLAAYKTLLANYNQLVTLVGSIPSDTASPDLQAAVDSANSFVAANPPPALPVPTPAPTPIVPSPTPTPA